MKTIYTRKQEEYFVDDADYEYLNQFNWWSTSRGHAQAYINEESVYMHQLLIDIPEGYIVDHIDRNPYNNQRSNLRVVTYSQNSANATKRSGTTSQYKGVSWYSKSSCWTMKFYEHGKQQHGGYFDSEHDAAREYNREMFRIHGDIANLNVIEDKEDAGNSENQ